MALFHESMNKRNSLGTNVLFLHSAEGFHEDPGIQKMLVKKVVLYKKAVLKNFAIFTRKHLCWNKQTFIKQLY